MKEEILAYGYIFIGINFTALGDVLLSGLPTCCSLRALIFLNFNCLSSKWLLYMAIQKASHERALLSLTLYLTDFSPAATWFIDVSQYLLISYDDGAKLHFLTTQVSPKGCSRMASPEPKEREKAGQSTQDKGHSIFSNLTSEGTYHYFCCIRTNRLLTDQP